MPLSKPRSTPARAADVFDIPVAAATVLYQGALACRNAAGNGVPGSVATTLKAMGRVEATADNSAGAAGAITVRVKRGCFRFANSSAGDAITIADVGNDCFIVDDETVAKTNGTNTRSRAGKIADVDADGVWVLIGIGY